jgi:hypothetical protein
MIAQDHQVMHLARTTHILCFPEEHLVEVVSAGRPILPQRTAFRTSFFSFHVQSSSSDTSRPFAAAISYHEGEEKFVIAGPCKGSAVLSMEKIQSPG